MHSASITALLALATVAVAVPTHRNGFPQLNLAKRDDYENLDPDNHTNQDAMCGHSWDDDSDMSDSQATWYQTGSGIWFDIWLKENGEDDWAVRLDNYFTGESSSPKFSNCATLDGDCGPPEECSSYFDKHMPQLYYIAWAANKANSVFSHLHQELVDSVIQNSLDIDTIISDFGGEDSSINPFGLAGAAFGIASGASFASGPLSGALGVISGAFGVAAQFYSPQDEEANLKDQLSDYFEASKNAIKDTLNNAFGVGEYDSSHLPAQTEEYYYPNSAIARFFADGKFLINDVNTVYKDVVEDGNKKLRAGLALRILNDQGYRVFVNTDIDDEDMCNEIESDAKMWMNDMCYCIYGAPEEVLGSRPISYGISALDSDIFAKLTGDDYGVDMTEFYNNAYDCQKNNPDGGDVDVTAIPYDGTTPPCFWNMKVSKGTFSTASGNFDEEDL